MLLFHVTILSKTTLPRWIRLFQRAFVAVYVKVQRHVTVASRFCSLLARGVILSICRTKSERNCKRYDGNCFYATLRSAGREAANTLINLAQGGRQALQD